MTRRAGSVPGRPDEDPAAVAEPPLGLADRPLERRIALPLVLVAGLHRPLLLGQQRDPRREIGERRAGPGHHPQHLEAGDDAVAGRRVLEDDDVAALLAAEAGPADLHPLEDVLVADGRPDHLAAGRLDDRLEPAVREDRDDEGALGEHAALEPIEGEDPEHLVAVDDPTRAVDRDQPIGVAVEGEPDVGAASLDLRGERGRRRGPGVDVDVHAVGLVVDDLDGRAGGREDLRADHRRRSRWRSRGRSAGPSPGSMRARPRRWSR